MIALHELHIAGWERIFAFELPLTGCAATGVVAIHNTVLGPGFGGVRVDQYTNEYDPLGEAMNLGRQMSFKSAAAGLPFGGAKTVLNVPFDPRADDAFKTCASAVSQALFDAYGEVVARINEDRVRYITAPDVNTNTAHMTRIHRITGYVSCLPQKIGIGDPSPYTALGVYYSMLAALKYHTDAKRIKSRTMFSGVPVLLQGYGKVGRELASLLAHAGAQITVVESSESARAAAAEAAFGVYPSLEAVTGNYLIFAPCATSHVIRPEVNEHGFDSIGFLVAHGVKIICGSANNQLAQEVRTAKKLYHLGILYIPDFVCNAGGLAAAGAEWLARTGKIRKKTMQERIRAHIRRIGHRVGAICAYARSRDDSTLTAAYEMARLNVRQKGGELW